MHPRSFQKNDTTRCSTSCSYFCLCSSLYVKSLLWKLTVTAGSPILRVAWTNGVDALSECSLVGDAEAVTSVVVAKLIPMVSSESNTEALEAQLKALGHWLAKSSKFPAEASKVYSTTLGDAKKQDKAKWFLTSLESAFSGSDLEKLKQIPEDLSKVLLTLFDKVKQRTTLRAEGLLIASLMAKVSVEAGASAFAQQITKAGVWEYFFSEQSFFLGNPSEFVLRLDAEMFPTLIRFFDFVCATEFFGKYWKNNESFFSLLIEAAVQGSWKNRQLALNTIKKAHAFNDNLSENMLAVLKKFLLQVQEQSLFFAPNLFRLRRRVQRRLKRSAHPWSACFLLLSTHLFLTTS